MSLCLSEIYPTFAIGEGILQNSMYYLLGVENSIIRFSMLINLHCKSRALSSYHFTHVQHLLPHGSMAKVTSPPPKNKSRPQTPTSSPAPCFKNPPLCRQWRFILSLHRRASLPRGGKCAERHLPVRAQARYYDIVGF